MDDAVKYDGALETFRAMTEQITGYYFIERCPSIEEGPSRKEISQAYKKEAVLISRIHREITEKK